MTSSPWRAGEFQKCVLHIADWHQVMTFVWPGDIVWLTKVCSANGMQIYVVKCWHVVFCCLFNAADSTYWQETVRCIIYYLWHCQFSVVLLAQRVNCTERPCDLVTSVQPRDVIRCWVTVFRKDTSQQSHKISSHLSSSPQSVILSICHSLLVSFTPFLKNLLYLHSSKIHLRQRSALWLPSYL